VKLSDLRPTPGSHKTDKRVGRGHGSGRGKTSGRGQKGQKARTGTGKIKRSFSGGQTRLFKRSQFLRGVGNKRAPFRDNYTIINVVDLELFDAESQITPEALVSAGMITPAEGRGLIKILGDGELDHKLTVHAHKFSASAKAKIEAAGGAVEIIPVKTYEKTKRSKTAKDPYAKAAAPTAGNQDSGDD